MSAAIARHPASAAARGRAARRLVVSLLALGALGAPAGCDSSGAPGEHHFCQQEPGGQCGETVIELVESADALLEIAMYTFTHDEIADAVEAARERGVQVQIVYDANQRQQDAAQDDDDDDRDMDEILTDLEEAGAQTKGLNGDSVTVSMHHKFTIVDRERVAAGSFNYTESGDFQNDENLVVFRSGAIARQYAREFQRLLQRE